MQEVYDSRLMVVEPKTTGEPGGKGGERKAMLTENHVYLRYRIVWDIGTKFTQG